MLLYIKFQIALNERHDTARLFWQVAAGLKPRIVDISKIATYNINSYFSPSGSYMAFRRECRTHRALLVLVLTSNLRRQKELFIVCRPRYRIRTGKWMLLGCLIKLMCKWRLGLTQRLRVCWVNIFCVHEWEGTSRAGCAFFVYIWFSPVRIS